MKNVRKIVFNTSSQIESNLEIYKHLKFRKIQKNRSEKPEYDFKFQHPFEKMKFKVYFNQKSTGTR
ncbi:hypothetical protein BpHYR1_000747 [Brachionus plicatilis]|uniref:Uncharacterized protein n=1 Tax=Brachionus plicatilis TaxID=10195 RepID=A0A3M7S3H7_BRAPC|nr:hypothetical protein BpHYR1_000747 [Brachionus plicatilis]